MFSLEVIKFEDDSPWAKRLIQHAIKLYLKAYNIAVRKWRTRVEKKNDDKISEGRKAVWSYRSTYLIDGSVTVHLAVTFHIPLPVCGRTLRGIVHLLVVSLSKNGALSHHSLYDLSRTLLEFFRECSDEEITREHHRR